MSWQQNAVSEITFGQDKRPVDHDKDKTAGDSSILRYIKKLTNHQTNAKQQRIDRYLQQVKHVQTAEDFCISPSKSSQYPSVTRNQHQQLQKNLKPIIKPRRNERVRNDRSNQQHVAAVTDHSRYRTKRSYGEKQGNRQLKKPKQKKQTTIIGSLERFRLHGAWSRKSDEYPEKSQDVTFSTGNKLVQPVQMQDLPHMPHASSSGFSTMRDDLERRPVQELRPLSVKTHAATVPTHDSCSSYTQPTILLSPEEAQPGNLDCIFPQQEDFIPTYDPLTTIMESIYF